MPYPKSSLLTCIEQVLVVGPQYVYHGTILLITKSYLQ